MSAWTMLERRSAARQVDAAQCRSWPKAESQEQRREQERLSQLLPCGGGYRVLRKPLEE